MVCPSLISLVMALVVVAAGVTVPRANAVIETDHGNAPRQASPVNNPGASRFLRRVGGAGKCCPLFVPTNSYVLTRPLLVTVLGDRIYHDGGSVSQRGLSGRPNNPSMSLGIPAPFKDFRFLLTVLLLSQHDAPHKPICLLGFGRRCHPRDRPTKSTLDGFPDFLERREIKLLLRMGR